MQLVKPISMFTLLLATAMPSAAHATCNNPWFDPYDPNKFSYSPITLTTHGGQSLSSSPQVVLEFWGASYNHNSTLYNGNDTAIIGNVATMLATNEFWSRYSQYGVTAGTMFGQVVYDYDSEHDETVDDTWLQQHFTNEFSHPPPGLPPYSSNNIYLIFLPWDITSPHPPGYGFHRWWPGPSGVNASFALVAAENLTSTCDQGCVDSKNSITAAHEVMEAVTNPDGNELPGQDGTGWYSPIPSNAPPGGNPIFEIGDLCNAQGEPVNGVTWQQSWLNDQCRCDGWGTPGVFFNTNYNFTWSPIGDWAPWSFKAQCSPGQPVVGVSQGSTSGTFGPHAALCGNGPDYGTKYPQSSCRSVPFDDGTDGTTIFPGNNPNPWTITDWQLNYYKAQCNPNEYVAGVSQSSTGAPSKVANQLDGILCCVGAVTQQSCKSEVLFEQNSKDFSYPDWDYGYYKAMCPQGQYVAGVSAFPPNEFVPTGAAYSVLCCSP
jgi:hypothetical protein